MEPARAYSISRMRLTNGNGKRRGLKNVDKACGLGIPTPTGLHGCGFAEFMIPEAKVRQLAEGVSESGSTGCPTLQRSIGVSRCLTELAPGSLREIVAL